MIRGKKSPVVHVIAYRKTGDKDPLLTVTPDPLDMAEFVKGDHHITWQLDTKGYRFSIDPNRPAIKFTSPGWEASFSDLKVDHGGRRATMHNRNRDGLAFSYDINVVEPSTGLTAFLDPVVQNRDQ
ncbi:MAG: hypothetical protein ABI605_04960 [Rhizobacter sp.]